MFFSICYIQFLVSLLWIFGWWRQHNVWNTWKANQIKLSLWYMLFDWKNLHNWIFTFLQASNATVLLGETSNGVCYNISASIWTLPWWWLEVCYYLLFLLFLQLNMFQSGWWLHLHNNHLQYFYFSCPLWTVFVLFCNSWSLNSLWTCFEVLYCKICDLFVVLAR